MSLAALVMAAALASREPQASFERAWVENTEVTMLGSKAALPTDRQSLPPLYVVAPIDPSKSQSEGKWGLGPIDQVAPQLFGKEARLQALLVVPGPAFETSHAASRLVRVPMGTVRLLFAADLDGDGSMENLTSTGRIERAIELRMARAESLDFSLWCLIRTRV